MKLLSGKCFTTEVQCFIKLQVRVWCISQILACILLSLLTCYTHASIGGYITTSDKKKFIQSLAESFKLQGDDISSAYYGAKGYKLLGGTYDKTTVSQTCEHIKKNFKLPDNLELGFNSFSTWSLLGCQGKLHTDPIIKVKSIYCWKQKFSDYNEWDNW